MLSKHFKFKHTLLTQHVSLILEGDVDRRREDSRDLGWKANKNKQKTKESKNKRIEDGWCLQHTPRGHVNGQRPCSLFANKARLLSLIGGFCMLFLARNKKNKQKQLKRINSLMVCWRLRPTFRPMLVACVYVYMLTTDGLAVGCGFYFCFRLFLLFFVKFLMISITM